MVGKRRRQGREHGFQKGPLFLCVFFCLCAVFSTAGAGKAIPDILRVTQEIRIQKMSGERIVTTSAIHSAREDVNEAIDARVAALAEEAVPMVPRGRSNRPARADICTQITRVGERWMSFHICAAVSAKNAQTWVKSEEYTYNMESGELISLGRIITEEGWEPLRKEIRRQIESRFPADEADGEALEALCRRENLEEAGFVMAPGHLALYFPAGGVYPDHAEALLRVEIYVPALRELLTEEAREESDCSGYELVALTYDDGPGKRTTRNVLNSTVIYPGQVTFFMIGKRLEKNAELVHRAYDAGHSVQSHTWEHATEGVKPEKLELWEQRYEQAMGGMTGETPVLMRPPGGHPEPYMKAGSEMPMILWQVNSQDVSYGDSEKDQITCYNKALSAKDGDIILFHDMKASAGELAQRCMKRFEEKNMLMVTVNDLMALRGVTPAAGKTVKSCPPAGGEKEDDR